MSFGQLDFYENQQKADELLTEEKAPSLRKKAATLELNILHLLL
jgi:hypothetical protein